VSDLLALPGVAEARRLEQGHLILHLTGNGALGAVLGQLAQAEPTALGVREPSLEEIFLEYYGNPA
jgi:ABC-2 type transport system ATP-binding protein